MKRPNILVVDDETAIADTILYALQSEGMTVQHELTGTGALLALKQNVFDLAILDVGLPDMSGFDLCRKIRHFSEIPIIFLTARAGEIDTVVGLELGADDYMTKPFSPRELATRVRVVLRRGRKEGIAVSGVPPEWDIDTDGGCASFRGERLSLTRYEFLLLDALYRKKGRIVSREQLMTEVWSDADSFDRTVDAHIKTLRAKLHAIAPEAEPIRTHRGLGYSLE